MRLADTQQQVLQILIEVLNLSASDRLNRESPLLGAIPELDSMVLAAVITAIEERFGFNIADDELDASRFATVGSLADFVDGKLNSST